MTSKQRAFLRGLASQYNSIFQIGKGGLSDNLISQLSDALQARELIKINVLDDSLDIKILASEICESTNSTLIQIIGNKIIIYKENKKNKKIILPN